jgi:hypothetical protein
MLERLRPRSVYDVLAAIACFGVLAGGTAYAANTIGTDDVIDESLTGADIKGKATPFVDGTLTGQDIRNLTILNADLASQSLSRSKIQNGAINGIKVEDDSLTGADIDEATLALGAEPWHEVPAPGFAFGACEGSFGTPWSNFDPSGNSTAAVFRDPIGIVHLKGTVKCSAGPDAGASILTLPAGYRPALVENFPSIGNDGGIQTISVSQTAGAVNLATGAANVAAGEALYLDGISWRCAPSGSNGCP